jgi:hypothetical protein
MYNTMAAYVTNFTFNDCTVRNIIMARFYLCENPRMRCKQIRQSSLRLRAKGGVVPPSDFYLPWKCEHQIHMYSHLAASTFFPCGNTSFNKNRTHFACREVFNNQPIKGTSENCAMASLSEFSRILQ